MQKPNTNKMPTKKASKIIAFSNILMIITVVIFVISSMLPLSPKELIIAKEENISILSYLASHFNNYSLDYVAPIVALVAMSKSFFWSLFRFKRRYRWSSL